MRKINFFVLVLLGLVVFSCSKDDSESTTSENTVIVNSTNLDGRISTANAGVIGKKNVSAMPDNFYGTETEAARSLTVRATTAATTSDVASDLTLSLIAEVEAPEIDGVELQATHVVVSGNYAYVSYNVQGADYKGAVETIDISDPTLPQIAMQVEFPHMDISSLALQDGILYMVGARDVDAYEGVTSPAVLVKMVLDNNMVSDNLSYIELNSYVGTDVVAGDSYYYSVSGSTGSLSAFSINDDQLASEISTDDLRAVGIDGDKLVTLSGSDGIHIYNISSMTEQQSISLPADVASAKRTIDLYDNHVFVAQGFSGMGIYSLTDGSETNIIPVATVDDSSVDSNDLVCNAVTVSDDHIFMAEGAAGIVVYSLEGTDLTSPTEIGALSLEGSANYVASGDNYIFVADGTGGLKILENLSSSPSDDTDAYYDCSSYDAYSGDSWLNINSGSPQSYHSDNTLAGLNVNDHLIWCGNLSVTGWVNVNSNGELDVDGIFTVGTGASSTGLAVNSTVIVTGNVTIYGQLTLNGGCTLVLVGDDAKLTITGPLYFNSGATIKFDGTGGEIIAGGTVVNNGGTITGSYTDVNNNIN